MYAVPAQQVRNGYSILFYSKAQFSTTITCLTIKQILQQKSLEHPSITSCKKVQCGSIFYHLCHLVSFDSTLKIMFQISRLVKHGPTFTVNILLLLYPVFAIQKEESFSVLNYVFDNKCFFLPNCFASLTFKHFLISYVVLCIQLAEEALLAL